MLFEVSEKSIEPHYRKNRIEWLLIVLSYWAILGIGGSLILLTCLSNSLLVSLKMKILLLLNSIGLYLCYLLIEKHQNISNNVTDKICGFFKIMIVMLYYLPLKVN